MSRRSRREAKRKRARRSAAPSDRDGVRIDGPNAPREGADAGPGDDDHERYIARRVRGYRGIAKRRFANAQRLAGQGSQLGEREARKAIDAIVRAFWWAEDTALEEDQHSLMHTIGRWTRTTFGCKISFDGERYHQKCPIAIAHKRFGFSIGFIGARTCSICGNDLSECPHMRGRTYWVRGGAGDAARCPVCLQDTCDHSSDRLYRVPVVSVIEKIVEMREVSLVPRPADPEARLTEIPMDTSDMREALGPTFHPGMDVSCDLCLGGCWGFNEMPPPEEREAAFAAAPRD